MIETVRAERKKQQKRTVAALLVSLLIHLLILLAAFVILSLRPEWIPSIAPPDPEPPEFTLLPPPEPPKVSEERGFIDSAQGEVTETPPEDARFESDQNTAASSEQPPQSDEPLPSVAGEEGPGVTLRSQDFALGPVREPSRPSPASPPSPPQPDAPETPPEAPKPEETPPEKPEATPTATPKPTPKPEDDALALLEPAPPEAKPPTPEPEVRKPEPPTPPAVPRPPGYQPETRVTRLTGGISNRGRPSVAALATPLGRYKKQLSDAIGSRWYYYVNDMLDLVGIGTVELRFIVRMDGSVERVQVRRNTSNESLASCSVRAIMEAEIPPIPKDVAEKLQGGRLEVDYSFTILGR